MQSVDLYAAIDSICIAATLFSFHIQRLQNGYFKAPPETAFTGYHSASIAADGKRQHMARESCLRLMQFTDVVLTRVNIMSLGMTLCHTLKCQQKIIIGGLRLY